MPTPNTGIPYVPEGTLDPAAGLNDALRVIDALLQTEVISMSLTAPPGGESDGDLYIVGSPATGLWAGQENNLAKYVAEGPSWQFYAAGTQIRIVKLGAAVFLYNAGAWVGLAPAVDAEDVAYDNATSGLTATEVQAAIDELAATTGGVSSVNGDTGAVFVAAPICIACSDETTALTTGTAKATFRMPYAFTLTAVRASVTTAPTGSVLTVDINEGGTTILSTKITIDATEKTSTTAATPPVISDAALADDAEITIDIDTVGSTVAGAGLKVWLLGYAS